LITGTLHEGSCTFMITFLQMLLKQELILTNCLEKITTHISFSKRFSVGRSAYETMWKIFRTAVRAADDSNACWIKWIQTHTLRIKKYAIQFLGQILLSAQALLLSHTFVAFTVSTSLPYTYCLHFFQFFKCL
jgi:hypothetical protein